MIGLPSVLPMLWYAALDNYLTYPCWCLTCLRAAHDLCIRWGEAAVHLNRLVHVALVAGQQLT